MSFRFRRLFVLVMVSGLLLVLGSQSIAGQVLPVVPDAGDPEILSGPGERVVASPSYTGCGGDIAAAINTDFEQQVVELVNATRAANGLPPFKRSADLDRAARYYATDMGQDDYFPADHGTYDRVGGELVSVCDMGDRVKLYYNWQSAAENIAAGASTPQSAMDLWMNSPPHKANILDTSNWEIGVGYYTGSGSWPHYWTQDFGWRVGVYPLIIDGEAAQTSSTSVSLYMYGDWQEVRFRNDNDAWTNWQPFQSTVAWTLNAGQGQHTVCVEMRNSSQTVQSCDTIYLSDSVVPPDLPVSIYLPMIHRTYGTGPVGGWSTIVEETLSSSESMFPQRARHHHWSPDS
jgi:uncharacterized protein YkwD